MINVLRSEWIKLRTVRMNWVLLFIAIAFPLIVSALTTALQNESNIDSENLLGLVTGTSVVTALLLGVVGAVSITSEFGFGTIRPTFAATPRRSTVIASKAIVIVTVTALVEAVVVIVTYSVCSAIASSRGVAVSLSDAPAGSAAIVGVIAFAGIVSLLGYGLGLMLRNTPAAVAVLILWPLLIENLLTALLSAAKVSHPAKFMPYISGIQLANPDSGSDSNFLSRVPAGLYFFTVTMVIVVIGAVLTSRRDA
ncbi:MAG: ABC transporter permease [Ilumatobacteraceae bacterium]